jgi:hypothetical protein
VPDYTTRAGLAVYLFEESYVLGFHVSDDEVALDLDVVLTDRHPRYEPPPPDEQFCYRRARLTFRHPSKVAFDPSGAPPARDATGEIDYDAIDTFTIDDDRYHLEGSWGTLDLTARGVDVVVQETVLAEDEARALVRAILDHAPDIADELRAQTGSLRVVGGRVTMLNLAVDPAAPIADVADGPLDVCPTVTDAAGVAEGELLLWITGGQLSALEFAWWTDEPPTALPDPSALVFG